MFDAAGYGLYSHYNPAQQQLIRRLMLEDWKKAGVKLPTYMKLVARFIIPLKVPDAWLKKLSHQTMSKMLQDISTPRYEFWACLHLYLIKKYSLTELRTAEDADIESLGCALTEFTDNSHAPEVGRYRVSEDASIRIEEAGGQDYAAVVKTVTRTNHEPFGATIEHKYQGVAVQQGSRLVTVLREVTSKQVDAQSYDLSLLDEVSP